MQTRWLGILAAVLAAVPGVGVAVDAPHDASFSDGACANCHNLYTTATSGTKNYNVGCTGCHDRTDSQVSFGFPWVTQDQAVPGVRGQSHSWTGSASADRFGVPYPSAAVLTRTLSDGAIQCATCHDPHSSLVNDPASRHLSLPLNTATRESGNGTTKGDVGGSAQLTLLSAGVAPKAFRLRVIDNGGGVKGFIISHDFGLAQPTWFKYVGGVWSVGDVNGPGLPMASATNVPLNDAAYRVTFTGTANVGDFWDFYVGFPFLRFSNVDDTVCITCHTTRNMNHVRASGNDPAFLPDGVRKFSHPVGDALGANGLGRDVADAASILDANGETQTVGDANASNDLVLRNGVVRCTTCHAVHNADSNSLTKDVR
jgi:hypothetical protein